VRNLLNSVFFRILKTTLYSTIALTFCSWIVQSSKYLNILNQTNIGLGKVFYLSSFLSVDIIAFILPISFSISSAFVFHRFVESNQLIALQSAGISPQKLLLPLLQIANVITVFLYIANLYLSPLAWKNFRNMEFQIKSNFTPPETAGTIFNNDRFSVYAKEYSEDFGFRDIFIMDYRNEEKTYSYYAKNGIIKDNILLLIDGECIAIDNAGNKDSVTTFESYRHDLSQIMDAIRKPEQANEKSTYALLNEDTNAEVNTLQKALFHQKVTSPLLIYIFSLMAFFMVLLAPHKRKKSYSKMSALISFIIVFQGVFFGFANASAKNLVFALINYFLVLIAISIVSALIFVKNRQ
jgi:lipopolysaccharide export system permease protein